jgi:hypothetical protein
MRILMRLWLPITLALLLAITALSLSPLPALPPVAGSDKQHHLLAYAAVAFPVALARPRGWPLWTAGLLAWSGGIELIQPYVNRYGEWTDLAANALGLALGVGLALAARRAASRVR